MPVSHRIDKSMRTVFVRAKGNVELEDLIKDEESIISNPSFEKGYNKYVDFTGAKPGPNASYEKIKMVAKFIEETQDLRGKCKWSVYAPHDDAFHFSVLFAKLTEELELETKVFDDEREAKEWLDM